jgi:hypothetical protein
LKTTGFGKRYANEFKRIERDLLPVSPPIAAFKLVELCAEQKTPEAQFNMAMVIRSRFNNVVDALDKKSADKLLSCEQSSLAVLMKKSGVKSIGDNRVPFYYWTKEKQGAAWSYYLLLKKSGKLDKSPEVLKSTCLAAALDSGKWGLVSNTLKSKQVASLDTLTKLRLQTWAPSLTFAQGTALERIGDGTKRKSVLADFTTMRKNTHDPRILAITNSLALEYAISTRQSLAPIAQKPIPESVIGLRVAILRFLTILENPKESSGKIQLAKKTLVRKLLKNPATRPDAALIDIAVEFSNGTAMDRAKIAKIIRLKPKFPNTTARVITSAIAKRHALEEHSMFATATLTAEPLPGEIALLKVAKNGLAPNIVSKNLWRRVCTLELAAKPVDMMAETADAQLKRYWISTTPFYIGLITLKAGAEIAAGKNPKTRTLAALKRYIDASPTASAYDTKVLEMADSEIPAEIVKSLFKSNQPEKAIVCAMFGIMLRGDDPKTKSEIVKVLNDNYSLMTWEERLMTRRVQAWRK